MNQRMEHDMGVIINAARKRALAFFGLALLAAFVAFLMIFIGHIDHFLAVGVSVLAMLGFVLAFNRAWALWERAGQELNRG
jgi:uncharacterized Tic20 family protein